MPKNKKMYWIGGSVVLVAVVLAFGFAPKNPCAFKSERKTVSGDSLSGLIESGSSVTLLRGYYNCRAAEKGDVVAYRAGTSDLIIKMVAAVPGDTWSLEDRADGHRIIVNGKILVNPMGKEYAVDDQAARVLKLYIRDFEGVIPPASYLVLGTATMGTYDSSRTGLVGLRDIVAKVQYR